MADIHYTFSEAPVYHMDIRRFQNTDPVNAETVVNSVIQQLIDNIHAPVVPAAAALGAAAPVGKTSLGAAAQAAPAGAAEAVPGAAAVVRASGGGAPAAAAGAAEAVPGAAAVVRASGGVLRLRQRVRFRLFWLRGMLWQRHRRLQRLFQCLQKL